MTDSPKIIPIKPPHSMYRLIGQSLELPYYPSADRPLHRICSLMRKMGALTVVSEVLDVSDDAEISEEINDLNAYFGTQINHCCTRLTFVDKEFQSLDNLKSLPEKSFLASVTILQFRENDSAKSLWHPYILRSVIALPSMPKSLSDNDASGNRRSTLLNNYYHVNCTYHCHVSCGTLGTRDFDIKGTYFCQQNGKTSVCAHSALKMTLNNLPGEVLLTTSAINKEAGISPNKNDNRFNQDDGWGMNGQEVTAVIESRNLNCQQFNFFAYPTWDYVQYTHRLIESKTPSLLVFSTSASNMHVVPVFGHTLNSDMWRPEAEFHYRDSFYRLSDFQLSKEPETFNHISSSSWVDHFIIHDDNFGPYFCLPVDSLRRPTLPNYDPYFRAYLLMGIFSKEVSVVTPSREAEWISTKVLECLIEQRGLDKIKTNFWLKHFCSHFTEKSPWVVRTALTDKATYEKHLIDDSDFDGECLDQSIISRYLDSMPDWFYISEVSVSDLYTANKSKLVDVLYACDKEPWNPSTMKPTEIFDGVLGIRLPGLIYVAGTDSTFSINTLSHIPLMRINPELSGNEW